MSARANVANVDFHSNMPLVEASSCYIAQVALCDMQATELLSRQTDIALREKELMKAVPDMDMINTFVGTVKISMPGLVKIKQDVRKNKKKK